MNIFVKVDGGIFKYKHESSYMVKDIITDIQVKVNDFYIDDFVITQADFSDIMGYNPSYFKGASLPVENVNWYESVLFCNKKSIKDNLTPCYVIGGETVDCNFDNDGYRLPTEAEWEFAAIGGNQSQNYKYAGSNILDEVAWYSKNSKKTTHAKGGKKPNELGLYDMCGNVFEWCFDWWGKFDKDFLDNPKGPLNGKMKVSRGNNWVNGESTSDLRRRVHRDPYCITHHQGFRIVRTAKEKYHTQNDRKTRLKTAT